MGYTLYNIYKANRGVTVHKITIKSAIINQKSITFAPNNYQNKGKS